MTNLQFLVADLTVHVSLLDLYSAEMWSLIYTPPSRRRRAHGSAVTEPIFILYRYNDEATGETGGKTNVAGDSQQEMGPAFKHSSVAYWYSMQEEI